MSCVWYLAFNIAMKPARAKRLNTVFWNFVWRGDTTLDMNTQLNTTAGHISRKVMKGKYCDGGLQAIDFQDQVQAMRVKWLKLLLDPQHTAKWKPIVIARLQHALSPWFITPHACICYKRFSPLIRGRMPALWRESFSAFTNLHPVQVPSATPSRLTVMRYPLWGHPDIGLGLTVRWQRWAEVDIHIVGDLWDPDTKDWYPLHEVVDNTDRFTVKDYADIIAAIPADWVEILKSEEEDDDSDDDSPGVLLSERKDNFSLTWGWKCADGSTTSLHNSTVRCTRLATLTSAPSKGPATWDKLYPHVRLDSPNWPRAWLAVHRLRADPNVRYFLWLVMHGALRVGEHGMIKKYLATTNTASTCTHCGSTETISHALFECPFAQQVWGALEPLLTTLLPLPWVRNNLQEWCLLGGFGSAGTLGQRRLSSYPDRVDAVRVVVPWLIWKARCNALFERVVSSPYDVARCCMRALTKHITLSYHQHAAAGTLDCFSNTWCATSPPLVTVDAEGVCTLTAPLRLPRSGR